jgi:choline monooxygenase
MADGMTLPHDFYFSEEIHRREQDLIFHANKADMFLGHKSFVPEKGDYWVIPHSGSSEILTNDGDNIHVVENICRHRYARMLDGSGNAHKIVCPVHYWSYQLDGTLIRAPGFDLKCEGECGVPQRSLGRKEIVDYDCFIMSEKQQDLKTALNAVKNYTSLRFDELDFIVQEKCLNRVNWKDYVDTFLDLYHIEAYHPGLTGLVNSNKIENFLGPDFHIQAVKMKSTPPEMAGGGFRPLVETYQQKIGPFIEPYGAIWITIYPNIMIEIYERYMVLNIVIPDAPEQCTVWKYSFCHKSLSAHQDILDLYNQFLAEVEVEDVDLMQRVCAGRKILHARGERYRGPFHPTKEDGQERFHRWLSGQLQPAQQNFRRRA